MIMNRPMAAQPLRLFRIAVAATILAGAITGTALAGKPGAGTPLPTGSCSVTPNPVALGAQYTMTAVNLPADKSVNVYVVGSGGTNTFFRYTGTSGSVSVTWYASWTGTNAVTVKAPDGRKTVTVASCSFSVY